MNLDVKEVSMQFAEPVSMTFADGNESEGDSIPQVQDVLRASDLTAMGSHIYNIPTKLSELTPVNCRSLGSNIGGLFKNEEGEKYYVKVPNEEDHARIEALATNLYALTDIQALENNLIEIDVVPSQCFNLWLPISHYVNRQNIKKIGIVTKWIEDIEDIDVAEMATVPDVRRGLAMDAWIGHYDNIGNYNEHNEKPVESLNMKRRHGKAFRIDFGGVFEYKAKGNKKEHNSRYDIPFSATSVDEWEKYQNKPHPFMWEHTRPEDTHLVFGGMTKVERVESLRVVTQISADDIRIAVTNAFPDQVHQQRRDQLIRTLISRQRELQIKLDLDLLCGIKSIKLDDNTTEGKTKQAQMWADLKKHGWLGQLTNKKKPEAMQDTLKRHEVSMKGDVAKAISKTITESKYGKISIRDLQKKYC
jgi:hypothetical protein